MRPEFTARPGAPSGVGPIQANRVWVSNITYLLLASGEWVYCCAFQDACCKQVVGWQMRADMLKGLVIMALQWTLLVQRPVFGLIAHSDWGGQYVGNVYKPCSARLRPRLKTDQRFLCLWSRLKTELLEARDWSVFTDLTDT